MADRELAARVRIVREGDAGAVRETAEDLERLGDAATKAEPALGELARAQQDAANAAADQRSQTEALPGTFATLADRITNLAARAEALWNSFRSGWEVGSQLRDVLNELSGGASDALIQKWTGMSAVVSRWVGVESDAARAAGEHQLALATLRSQGIDPTGLSLEEVLATYRKLGAAQLEQRNELEKSNRAWRDFLESNGLAGEQLEAQADRIRRVADRLREMPASLQELGRAKLAPDLQDFLDKMEAAGREVPGDLQKIAQAWNVTTSATQQAAERQARLVDELRERILGTTRQVEESAEELAQAIPAAFEKIDFKELKIVDPEAFERAKQVVAESVETFRQAGEQIPQALAEAAAETGAFVGAMETGGGAITVFSASLDEVRQGAVRVEESVDSAGRRILKIVDDTTPAAEAVGQIGDAASEAGGALKDAAGDLDAYGSAASSAAQATEESASRAGDAAEAYGSAAEKTRQGTDALAKQADAASDAASGLEEAAGSTKSFADGQEAVASGARGAAEAISDLEGKADGLLGKLEAVGPAFEAAFAAGVTQGLVAELQKLDGQIEQTLAKLSRLREEAA